MRGQSWMVAETDHTLPIGSAISLEQLKLPISLQCSGVGSGVPLAPPIILKGDPPTNISPCSY